MDNKEVLSLQPSTTPPLSNIVPIKQKGISKDRILNLKEIEIINDLIKCTICLEIILKPYECDICGSLFCESCITEWLSNQKTCPMKCTNYKITKAKINTRKMLNLVQLKCLYAPDCNVETTYWRMLEHESQCPFQKMKCPNFPCNYEGSFKDIKPHLLSQCPYVLYECGFCKSNIPKNIFETHLETHTKDHNFVIVNCSICESNENLRRCLCKKIFCEKCFSYGKDLDCIKNCYLFHTGQKITTQTYHISKYPLPKNFEAKLFFPSVHWIRVGISFNQEIVENQEDMNCPPYDIYYIL